MNLLTRKNVILISSICCLIESGTGAEGTGPGSQLILIKIKTYCLNIFTGYVNFKGNSIN